MKVLLNIPPLFLTQVFQLTQITRTTIVPRTLSHIIPSLEFIVNVFSKLKKALKSRSSPTHFKRTSVKKSNG